MRMGKPKKYTIAGKQNWECIDEQVQDLANVSFLMREATQIWPPSRNEMENMNMLQITYFDVNLDFAQLGRFLVSFVPLHNFCLCLQDRRIAVRHHLLRTD
ncbi:hypothetical protein AWENTII_008630 [Aspergillus wentii]